MSLVGIGKKSSGDEKLATLVDFDRSSAFCTLGALVLHFVIVYTIYVCIRFFLRIFQNFLVFYYFIKYKSCLTAS